MVLIGVAVLIIIFLVYNSNKNKKAKEAAAAEALLASQSPQGNLPAGGSSQVAQVIGSLFPYFQTAADKGLIVKKT